MKKIFTLLATAAVATSVSAQSEIWRAADYNLDNVVKTTLTDNIFGAGNAEAPDKSVPGTLTSWTITATTASLTMTGESTPNACDGVETVTKAWELKGSEEGNDALIVEGCDPHFAKYLMGKGNPEDMHWEFQEETDNGTSNRVYGTFWEPGKDMPAKGNYWKFEVTKAGSLKLAFYGNKNTNPTYVVDAATKQPLPCSSINLAFFYQNNGFTFTFNDETISMNVGTMPENYVIQQCNGVAGQNRPVLGYMTFPAEAGKTYYVFNPKSQIGLYGFEFTPSAQDSIADIISDANLDEDAPIYNVLGQRVTKEYKGILIQNGKKFINR